MTTEIDGHKFRLTLSPDDKQTPYVLHRWKRANGVGRWHWATVWANWHVGTPTGINKRAIAAMGYVWRNDSAETIGWHQVGA